MFFRIFFFIIIIFKLYIDNFTGKHEIFYTLHLEGPYVKFIYVLEFCFSIFITGNCVRITHCSCTGTNKQKNYCKINANFVQTFNLWEKKNKHIIVISNFIYFLIQIYLKAW